jgi:hypothetical protein
MYNIIYKMVSFINLNKHTCKRIEIFYRSLLLILFLLLYFSTTKTAFAYEPGEPEPPPPPLDPYACIAEPMSEYLNALCEAKANGTIPANVRLLSPAFNMTSYTFIPLMEAMNNEGWGSCLYGWAGNIYDRSGPGGNNGPTIQEVWEAQKIDQYFPVSRFILQKQELGEIVTKMSKNLKQGWMQF